MTIPNLETKTILVVEDDDMSFLYLNQLFMLTKCRLIRAKTGSDAINQFRNALPDLVFMDIQLPDMDGTEVTRKLLAGGSDIPVVAQTAERSPTEKEKALLAGCSEILIKPISMDDLFSAIGRYL
jgi:CheY-like chemotaxis protein